MQFMILMLMNVIVLVLVLFLPPVDTKSEREAQQAVCQQLAQEVSIGAATRFDYMATRCSAELIAQDLSD